MSTKRYKKYSQWSRRVERNILSCYHRANESDRAEGMYWYAQAHALAQAMAEKHSVTLDQAVGVIAVLSPGCEWGRNVIDADLLIEAFKAGDRGRRLPTVGVYGKRNVGKAMKILKGAFPLDLMPVKTSPKVRAFYSSILDPQGSKGVCVDRHAKGLAYNLGSERKGYATNDKLSVVRPAEYGYLAWHYVRLAERLGLIPHQLQAITWVTWKRLKGQLEQADLPF